MLTALNVFVVHSVHNNSCDCMEKEAAEDDRKSEEDEVRGESSWTNAGQWLQN